MRVFQITAGALALAWSGTAAAASYTDTHTLTGVVNLSTDPLSPNYYSESYAWAGFNTALGTLTSVTLSLNSAVRASGTYRAYVGRTVAFQANESVSLYVNGISPVFSGSATGTTTLSPAGVAMLDVIATGSQTFTSAADLLRFSTSPLCCNMYIGLPNSVRFDGTAVFSDAPGTILAERTDIAITYVFTAVPEPASWATMLVGMAGAGAALRRRRARAAAPA